MPAVSEKQRRFMAMKYSEGKPPKGMSLEQVHDFMYKSKKTSNKNKRRSKRSRPSAVDKLMSS
jgi:hypothetical protein